MATKNDITYILYKEHYWDWDKKSICPTHGIFIRPVMWSYKKCNDFFLGKMRKNVMMQVEGSMSSYFAGHEKKSIEEWLVGLALEGIVPDFERHELIDRSTYNSYIYKTIDLKTGKTISDYANKITKQLASN